MFLEPFFAFQLKALFDQEPLKAFIAAFHAAVRATVPVNCQAAYLHCSEN